MIACNTLPTTISSKTHKACGNYTSQAIPTSWGLTQEHLPSDCITAKTACYLPSSTSLCLPLASNGFCGSLSNGSTAISTDLLFHLSEKSFGGKHNTPILFSTTLHLLMHVPSICTQHTIWGMLYKT